MAETFAWADRAALTTGVVTPGGACVVVLVASAPDLTETAISELDDVGDRGDTTWLVSLGSPSAVSVDAVADVDPGTDCVGIVFCNPGASDALRKPVAYQAIDETDDPVPIPTGTLFTANKVSSIDDLLDGTAATGEVPVKQADGTWAPEAGGGGGGSTDTVLASSTLISMLGLSPGDTLDDALTAIMTGLGGNMTTLQDQIDERTLDPTGQAAGLVATTDGADGLEWL